jgi:hypothetical protein
MTVWISALIVTIIGLLGYCFTKDGKSQAIFLHCFWVGLLAFLLTWGGFIVSIRPAHQ